MTERLRIAVLSRNFSTTGGGAERYSIAVVEQLAQHHEVHVFAQTIAHQFPGVQYHRIPMPVRKPRWINQLYFAWSTWCATRKGFDIVHSHENHWFGNVQTVHVLPVKHTLFLGKRGIRWWLTGLKVMSSPRLLVYLWLERQRYAFARKKKIVCTSRTLRDVVQASYPAAAPMLEVVTPGVPHVPGLAKPQACAAARTALGLPASAFLILFVGNDFVKKGLPALIQAVSQLPLNVHVAVVGKSESRLTMQRQVSRAGLADRVHFLGSMKNMAMAYVAADMLAHPTLEDAYAMVVLEAMSHGLPVVVSALGYCGVAQDLTDHHNALILSDPRDVDALAMAMTSIQSDAGLYGSLSAQGIAFAAAHSWQQTAAAHLALYQSITPRYPQRWLVLSHAFNMDGRAASQTVTDKLPHLAAAGVELVVLSGVSGLRDTLYEHYQLWPAGPAGIRFELRHVLRRGLKAPAAYRTAMVLLSLPLLPFMLVEKLLRPVESSWSWWLSAYLKGRALARHRKFDLIYSTGGAFAAHVAGRALKQALGVRWLAEVHDPLVTPGATPTSAQERMQAEVEGLICRDADAAIWFTDQALASAKRRHPELGTRGHMVLAGIDAPFKDMPPYVPGPKCVIGHFGSLSATRNLLPVIQAMEYLQDREPDLAAVLELHVYGGPLDAVSAAYLAQSTVARSVRHFGRVEADAESGLTGREKILRLMRAVDVLLLLHGTEPICAEYIPSKMYEYLWMQRPILATVYDNPQMADILQQAGHQVVSMFPDIHNDDMTTRLESIVRTWRDRGLSDRLHTVPYTTFASAMKLFYITKNS